MAQRHYDRLVLHPYPLVAVDIPETSGFRPTCVLDHARQVLGFDLGRPIHGGRLAVLEAVAQGELVDAPVQGCAISDLVDVPLQWHIDPFSYNHILIPYNVHENHWITVAVGIESRRVYVFDSLPCRTKALQRVFEVSRQPRRATSPALRTASTFCSPFSQSVQAWLIEYEKLKRDELEIGEPEPEPWSLTIPASRKHVVRSNFSVPLRSVTGTFNAQTVDIQLNLDDCGPLMLQTIMDICRLQNLDAVAYGFGQYQTALSTTSSSMSLAAMAEEKKQKSQDLRRKMSIELIQQKLLLRTEQDDLPMWTDPTKAASHWQRTCMLGVF